MRRPDWFLVGMACAVGLAWVWPDPGAKGGSLYPELLNKLGVALVFLLHGLLLPLSALEAGTRKWRLHLLVQASTFVLFPGLGLLLLAAVGAGLGPELRTGLFFLCALPSTVSSSVALTAAAGGDVPAALFNATLSTLLGLILTPLWLGFALGAAGSGLPLGAVLLELCAWLLLPLLVGQLLRPGLGAGAERHRRKLNVVDRLAILLLVYTSFCDSVKGGAWRQGTYPLLISALVSALLLTLGLGVTWAVARSVGLERGERIAAMFCGSKKSLASGVPIANVIFDAQPNLAIILLPIMIYHPLQLVVGGWLARRFSRQSA